MHRLTKATQIPKNVKETVYKRDDGKCILCHKEVDISNACCHYIARSHNGLGIEENILTLCASCHYMYDNSPYRKKLKIRLHDYLKSKYDNWKEENLVYKKWR